LKKGLEKVLVILEKLQFFGGKFKFPEKFLPPLIFEKSRMTSEKNEQKLRASELQIFPQIPEIELLVIIHSSVKHYLLGRSNPLKRFKIEKLLIL
jgi:hypothetical protein